MEPFTLGLEAVGLGAQLFGGFSGASVARQTAQVSANVAQQEQGIQQQKLLQVQMEARRSTMQNFRNIQRARAESTAAAVSGGQSVGVGMQTSGYQGGEASATNQGLFNQTGINNSLQIAQNIFGYTSQINADKMQLAQLGGQAATDQGIASLGGSLLKAGPIIGAFGKNLSGFSLFGGGSPTGYGTG